ncbi:MAG TPA: response regulator transcription factor [Bacteroidetes bacterium]|nr:response regulator transcription factor [Bacteroidota bacterium]
MQDFIEKYSISFPVRLHDFQQIRNRFGTRFFEMHLSYDEVKKLLKEHESIIEIIGEADNGEDGYILANKERPDLIFLDIQMPVLNGFEMLEYLEYNPKIIFTTAYEEYAIAAFEENSIDYLLKPIKPERLEKTIDKISSVEKVESDTSIEMEKMMQVINRISPENERDTIAVSVGEKIIFIKFEDIVFFKAEDKYVFIHDKDNRKHIIDYSLSSLEKKLPPYFFRVHKGFNGKYIFIMNDFEKTQITCGTSYIKGVKQKIKF